MSQVLKNGKKPLSTKGNANPYSADEIFNNKLKVSVELKAEIEAAHPGYEYRFIDYKKFSEEGQHDKGWIPYKRKRSANIDSEGFTFGQSPDGLVKRGSVVLAIRPKELGDKHREFLKQKADRYKSYNQERAAELRKMSKDGNINAEIYEGYEDNDTDN